jgi:tight adherence protein C
MNRIWFLAAVGGGTVLLIAGAFALLRIIINDKRWTTRVQLARGQAPVPAEAQQETLKNVWERVLATLGRSILRIGFLSARTRAELELTLASSGLRGRTGLEVFIGSKIGMLVTLPLLGMLALQEIHLPSVLHVPSIRNVLLLVLAVIGLLLPDIVVRWRRKKYIQRVELGLPDALDLLMICSQAGLGLKAAIVRVANEMQVGTPAIGQELAMTATELEMMDSRKALQNMGTRTGVEGLVRLANTLLQSMQYGTPLTDSMRLLSSEMRTDTLTRFEAKAARLGVLLTLPMIVFILPCLFIILGGPAAIQVMHIGSP